MLQQLLIGYDWYWEFSNDSRTWESGRTQQEQIKKACRANPNLEMELKPLCQKYLKRDYL
jgi:hypothetical protein